MSEDEWVILGTASPKPDRETAYTDISLSNLLSSTLALGRAEASLIWQRTTAFLVANSAILGLVATRPSWSGVSPSEVLRNALALVVGLVLCWLWYVTTKVGWLWQDEWYQYANRIQFRDFGNPATIVRGKLRQPDQIRWYAFALIITFVVAYVLFLMILLASVFQFSDS